MLCAEKWGGENIQSSGEELVMRRLLNVPRDGNQVHTNLNFEIHRLWGMIV